jgi:23S rRNA (cytosine1962-C5)-methyltransferase
MNIKLELGGTKRLAAGHPWVRREDLSRFSPPPLAGTAVRLQDNLGNFLGHAVSQGPQSRIPYLILSLARHADFDEAFFADLIEQALAARSTQSRASETFQRLVHGEADGLPGVFCDRVGTKLLLSYESPGLAAFAAPIEKALLSQAAPEVLWRRMGTGAWEVAHGKARQTKFSAERSGLAFQIRLDEAESCDFPPEASADWERVREFGIAGEALCVFSRFGAWPAALAQAGATKISCLDRDEAAHARAKESWKLSGLKEALFETESGDAFARLEAMKGKGLRKFEVLCLDPPAESHSPHGRFLAAKQLPALLERSLALAAPSCILLLSMRQGLLSAANIEGHVAQGAQRAGLKLETLALQRAAPDFPELEGFPEGRGRFWQAWKISVR